MKIGSIGYATYQGLGLLLKDFYENKILSHVMTVNHWKYLNYSWYNGPSTEIRNFDFGVYQQFCDGMDVMVFFETPFHLDILFHCKRKGIKTILMPMHECTPSIPEEYITKVFAPSRLELQKYPNSVLTPVPIPRWVEWKQRKKAEVFVHNAGHGGLKGRNGTLELVKALEFVKSPIKLIIRSQEPLPWPVPDPRVEIEIGTVSKEELYNRGDVFLFPEKFNGLSLPLQEAKAAGMLIMATNRFPINTWNEETSLIPVERYVEESIGVNKFSSAVVNPRDIAAVIDAWYGRDITKQSIQGRVYRERNSWGTLRNLYMNNIMRVAMEG